MPCYYLCAVSCDPPSFRRQTPGNLKTCWHVQDTNTRLEQISHSGLGMQSGICPFKGQRSNSLLVSLLKGQQPGKGAQLSGGHSTGNKPGS